jgi:hypothetical protein
MLTVSARTLVGLLPTLMAAIGGPICVFILGRTAVASRLGRRMSRCQAGIRTLSVEDVSSSQPSGWNLRCLGSSGSPRDIGHSQ